MVHEKYKQFGLLFFCMVCLNLLTAQNFPSLQFAHLTTKEGLSSNFATAIAEDRQGFIWIGTGTGLNRYDGYRFKHYYHSNSDTNSLVSNDVQTLYCDSRGRLWIGTGDGVSCFIPGSNQFINYSNHSAGGHQLKNNSSVRIYEDSKNMIWLCNQHDVIYRVNSSMQVEELKITVPAFSFYQETKFGYENIFCDRQDNEWAFTANRIYALNKQTKQPVNTFDLSADIHANIIKMLQDDSGNYLLSTWNNGLFYFYPATGALKPLAALPKRIFTDVQQWEYQKNKWLCCLEANLGLYLVDKNTQAVKNYSFIPGDPSSIQGNNYFQFFTDSKTNIWIGSNSGINLLTTAQQSFEIIPVTDPGSINYSLYKNGPVFSYLETDSSVWIGKRFVSTFEYSKSLQLKNYYTSLAPLSAATGSANGYAYYFFEKGKEIFITTDSGLVVLNTANKTTKLYSPPQLPPKLNLRTVVPFKSDELLIRSFDNGLFVFNMAEKKFTKRYSGANICSTCSFLKINYLFKTGNMGIYLCTGGQKNNLLHYEKNADSFTTVKITNGNSYPLQAADIFSIAEDGENNLWIASAAGLFVYNPAGNSIVKQVAENKEMGSLFRICFDNAGNLWGNSASGIWCYVKATGKWISFSSDDGLPGSQFEGIIARRPNGDIVAGLEGAVAVFHPEQLFSKNYEPPSVITEATISDSVFLFPLIKTAEKKLLLQPGQSSFSVDFALLQYVNPVATRYYYKLAPLMKDFQLNDNGHINFNGLAPGSYTLHVKGGNKTGVVYLNEDTLIIEVLPHWYQTTWFKLISSLLIAALVYWFVKWRIGSVKKQAGLKQKIAETEMEALRAQMNPHFIFNSLNSIENFMMQNEKRLASDYLNKFARLIRSILDSSSNEWIPLAKELEALQWYVDLQQLRLNNKFSYHTDIDEQLLRGDYKVPSMLIQPFVENAIEHGLAHSDKSNLVLKVKAGLENDYIVYSIEDNGVGRQLSAEYNRQNKPYHKSAGLSITTDRINMLNGEQDNKNVLVTDLYDKENKPAGTRVLVKIKLQ